MADSWYNDATLIRSFGQALIDAGVLEDTDDVGAYFSHPQRYNDEYDAWVENGSPKESDNSWNDFIDAISDDESDDEDEDA